MKSFFTWIVVYHRLVTSSAIAVVAGAWAAYRVFDVLRRLDKGHREPVGRQVAWAAILTVVVLAATTNAATELTKMWRGSAAAAQSEGPIVAFGLGALHPADYAYLYAILMFAIGAAFWAYWRNPDAPESVGDPDTSRLLFLAGAALLLTLWVFQRGVEQYRIDPKLVGAPQLFGAIVGAGLLAMAIIQGLRTVLPLRGVFHRVTLERWIDDACVAEPSPAALTTSTVRARSERTERIWRSVTRLARGQAAVDKYALLDLPVEQLCGQIAAGADRLLDAPFPATLETTSKHQPATVQEVLTALADGDKEIDNYLRLAAKLIPQPDAGPLPGASGPSPGDPQEYLRLRTVISQRIQRNIDGLQISTTFWWRRVVRTVAFSVSGVLGLSIFSGSITYSVMCAIVGGFVATVARDLVAIIEKGRR